MLKIQIVALKPPGERVLLPYIGICGAKGYVFYATWLECGILSSKLCTVLYIIYKSV